MNSKEGLSFFLQMIFRLVTIVIVICITLPLESHANEGYGEGGGYEAPPPKTKFNIGFNLPAMSISLPKLELPQISIKASVKNKKPFTLKMPVIKFNAHASTEEDHEYGGGSGGYAPPPAPAYGEGDGGAAPYPSGPTAYASSPNGISGYASSIPEMPAYAASSANPKLGYERPSAGQYNDVSAQPQAQVSGSAYSPAPDQNQNSNNPYANMQTYSRPIQQGPPQQQPYMPQNQGYTPQAHQPFTPQHNYQIQPQPQQLQQQTIANQPAIGPAYQVSPAITANGYHVPRPAHQANQVPEYRDENVKYYGSAPLYQSTQPAPTSGSGPVVDEYYGARLRPSGYGRRSTRPYLEHMGGVFLASASDNNGPFLLTPYNERIMERMDFWHPLMQQ